MKYLGLWLGCLIWLGIALGKNSFKTDNLDWYFLNQRRGYYENAVLGKLNQNKPTMYMNLYLEQFFTGLDPNYYFYGNHPREISGASNKVRIFYPLIILFIYGLYKQLRNNDSRIAVGFLTTLVVVSLFGIDQFWWSLVIWIYASMLYPFLKSVWAK